MGLVPGQTYVIMNNNGKDIKAIKPIEELGKHSSRPVLVTCDFCGIEKTIGYESYCKNIEKHNGKYVCKDCFNHNEAIVKETVSKRQATCKEKYGFENPSQVPEFKNKRKETYLERYGVEHILQSEEFKDKFKSTCMERLGVEYPMQSLDVQKKSKETCMSNYGVEHPLQNEELLHKARDTAFENNGYSSKISTQQIEIYNLLKNKYPEAICELNKSEGRFDLDIYFEIDNTKIDIECDGYYYHYVIKEDQPQKDRVRDEINKRKDYKILRIVYKEIIPNEIEIFDKVDELINSDKKFAKLISEDVKEFF